MADFDQLAALVDEMDDAVSTMPGGECSGLTVCGGTNYLAIEMTPFILWDTEMDVDMSPWSSARAVLEAHAKKVDAMIKRLCKIGDKS